MTDIAPATKTEEKEETTSVPMIDLIETEGFEFMAWAVVTIYEDNSFSYHLWNSTDRVTKDTKLTARWRKTSNKITFMSADGKVIKEFRKPIIFN